MRLISLCAIALAIFATDIAVRPTQATEILRQTHAGQLRQSVPQTVDDHDGSRVGVQLAVTGIAAGLVVGVGTGAYFLRRRLGLTAYSPEAASGGPPH